MTGIKAKVSGLRPKRDAAKYTMQVHKDLIQIWNRAAQQFVGAVVLDSIKNGHVDTGMSMGSLVPLATKVRIGGKTRSDISGARRRPSRKGYAYNKSGRRSLNAGIQLGRKAYKITYGSVRKTQFNFEFDTVVFQHTFHEPNWRSLDKGRLAFLAYLREEYSRYFSSQLIKLKGLL